MPKTDRRKPKKRPSRQLMRRYIVTAAVVAVVVLAAVLFAGTRSFKSYRVLRTDRFEDTTSSWYGNVNGFILQYNTDGARLCDRQGEENWSISFSLRNPDFVTCGNTMALYDKNGTSVVVADRDGKRGEFTTKLPIVRVCVSEQGNVAVLQEDDSNAWIEYYSEAGTEIASIRTSMDDPGYPLSLAISPDGELMAVSYLSFKGGIQKSVIHVYSFGETGQNQMDNRIAAFDYNQRIAPEVFFLNNKTLAAYRDNGFTIYEGARVPKAVKEINVDRQITSVFHDDSHIGLIMNGEEEDTWQICTYGRNGREQMNVTSEFAYDRVELYQDEISLYDGEALCVYDSSGKEKFNGAYDGEPRQFFAIGKHRYIVVTETGIAVIQLK